MHLKLWQIINLPQHPEIKQVFELPEQHVFDYQISQNRSYSIDLADLPPTLPYSSYTSEDGEEKRGAREIFDRFFDELRTTDGSKSKELLTTSPFTMEGRGNLESLIDEGVLAIEDGENEYVSLRTRTYRECLKLFLKQLEISNVPYRTEERANDTFRSSDRSAQ